MLKTRKISNINIRVSDKTRTNLFRKAKQLDITTSCLLRELIEAVIEDRITLKPPQPKGLYK